MFWELRTAIFWLRGAVLIMTNTKKREFFLLSDVAGVRPQRQGDRGEREHVSQRWSDTGRLPDHGEGFGQIGGGKDWEMGILDNRQNNFLLPIQRLLKREFYMI